MILRQVSVLGMGSPMRRLFQSLAQRPVTFTDSAQLNMSGADICYDNAVVERFFGTLKTECVTRVFSTRAEARTTIFEYLWEFGTIANVYTLLGYHSPVGLENLTL
jgi:transposase InsO family protein